MKEGYCLQSEIEDTRSAFLRDRLKRGLIEAFKWYRWYNKGNMSEVLRISSQDKTRNNGLTLEKFRFRKEIGKNCSSDSG